MNFLCGKKPFSRIGISEGVATKFYCLFSRFFGSYFSVVVFRQFAIIILDCFNGRFDKLNDQTALPEPVEGNVYYSFIPFTILMVQRTALIVLDGFGINNKTPQENAIILAPDTPTIDWLFTQPYTSLHTSGREVGLPA